MASVDVHLDPTVIFLSDANSAGSFTVTSSEKQDVVVSLRVIFGHPGSRGDSARLDAAPADDRRSCAPYIKLKEERFHLGSGQRHTVMFDAAMPASASQGEYWAQIVVTWSVQDAASPANPTGLPSKTVSLVYRKGNPLADIKLVNAGAERVEKTVRFHVDVALLGDAAYRGNVQVVITNAKRKTILTTSSMVDIYGNQRLTFDINGTSMPPGLYKAVVRFDTERTDLGNEVIPVLPKRYTIDFSMP